MDNLFAINALKEIVSNWDSYGNLVLKFKANTTYYFNNNLYEDVLEFEIKDIVGFSDPKLEILSNTIEIDKYNLHTTFNSAFGKFKFDEKLNLMTIEDSSNVIGIYKVEIIPIQ
jgi:hypothetical protein